MTVPAPWLVELSRITGYELDDMPPTVTLSGIGRTFADRIGELTEAERARVLELVEERLVHGDEYEKDAAATGFLEALTSEWDEGFDLEALWPLVGPESRAYCVAWNEFNGVPSPAWMRGDQT